MSSTGLFLLRSIVVLACLAGAPAAHAARTDTWDFTVYLDDRRIGQHRFRLDDRGEEMALASEARFEVKVLVFPLYDYEHEARELWRDDCLLRLDSRTDDNGTEHRVLGAREQGSFVVSSQAERDALPPCVMTFAYWNPRMREQRRLLNPQTGEYVDVSIRPAGRERIVVRGEMVEADRYEMRGRDLEITLWYAASDDRWVALESPTQGAGRLRYRIE